jgi:hypothetical protein
VDWRGDSPLQSAPKSGSEQKYWQSYDNSRPNLGHPLFSVEVQFCSGAVWNGVERRVSQFYTICYKNQLLTKNIGKVMAILVLRRQKLSLLVSIKEAHASHPRGARAREIHFLQILYNTLRRTSHHSGGPRNFDILVFLVRAGRSHASVCFYRTRNAQRVRDLCLVFWAPSSASLIHIKSYRAQHAPQRSQLSSRSITCEPVPIPPFCKRLQIAWMVVSTMYTSVQLAKCAIYYYSTIVLNLVVHIVGRNRQAATGHLIICAFYLLICWLWLVIITLCRLGKFLSVL